MIQVVDEYKTMDNTNNNYFS